MKGVLLIIKDRDRTSERERKRRCISLVSAACAALIFAVLAAVVDGSYTQAVPTTAESSVKAAAEEETEDTVIVTVPPSFAAQPMEIAEEEILPETVSGNYVLKNGETVGIVSDKGRIIVEEYVEEIKASCVESGGVLIDTITFESGSFDPMEIISAAEVNDLLELRIMNISTESEVSAIEAGVVYEPTNKLFEGSSMIDTEGADGEMITIYKVTEINGEVVSREEVTRIVSVPAVDTVILEGTREKVNLTAQQLEVAGEYIFPLTGSYFFISSEFGYREFDDTFHNGTDYAADMGTPVYAACDGTVIFSGWNETGYGNYILLEHSEGFKTGYAHLSDIFVEEGDVVSKGDLIGAVGSSGNSTGNHLHLVVKYDDQFVDPRSIFG